MSRTLISAAFETDRSYVTAQSEDGPWPKAAMYYYADAETAEIPFTLAWEIPIGGVPLWLEMTTEEFGEWLRALTQLYNDAIRDGR